MHKLNTADSTNMILMSFESSGNALCSDVFRHARQTTVSVATCGKPNMPQNRTWVLNTVNRTMCRTPAENETIMDKK